MDATINPPASQTNSRVLTPDLPLLEPEAPARTSTPAAPRVRKIRTFPHLANLGVFAQRWAGILFWAGLGAALWRGDAHFTLFFFAGWVPSFVALLGGFQWVIPVLFTLGQIYFFVGPTKLKALAVARALAAEDPENETLYRKYAKLRKTIIRHFVAFLIISAMNVGTSMQGAYEWAAKRFINLFGGFTLPEPGWPLRIVCLVIGVVLAFGVEYCIKATRDEYLER